MDTEERFIGRANLRGRNTYQELHYAAYSEPEYAKHLVRSWHGRRITSHISKLFSIAFEIESLQDFLRGCYT